MSNRLKLTIVLVAAAAGGSLLLGVWLAPKAQIVGFERWDFRSLELENELRQTWIQFIGGVLLLAGLAFSWIQHRSSQRERIESARREERGQATERFSRAMEHLSATDDLVRQLGG